RPVCPYTTLFRSVPGRDDERMVGPVRQLFEEHRLAGVPVSAERVGAGAERLRDLVPAARAEARDKRNLLVVDVLEHVDQIVGGGVAERQRRGRVAAAQPA